VKRRPESEQAHFTLAVVLRYAGLLEEASRECDNALALDPGNYTFRSCTFAFQELDKPGRAMDFLRLDAGSEYANYALPYLLLREGKVTEAREAVKKMAAARLFHRDLLQACLSGPPSELDRIAHEDETGTPSDADPELVYDQGAILAYCGKKDAAFHMLTTAIEQNYCAYSTLLSDPLLTKLRSDRIARGEVFGAGRHYLGLSAVWKTTDLLSVQTRVLSNLGDPSALVVPVLEYWAKQRVIVRAGGTMPCVGCCQRTSASTPVMLPERRSTFGW
jgi:tetratricopeptide (TPR) repeat protein